MKTIQLTKGQVALVDDEDYLWLNQWKWHTHKGYSKNYARRFDYSQGKKIGIFMHSFILKMTNSKFMGDHENGNGLDNQRHNLRIATKSQNAKNKTSAKNSSSKYLGVSWHKIKKKWTVIINNVYIGDYKNEIEAALAYNEAAKIHHKEFANLNIL
jgi:hypothetical protein